MLSGAKHLQFRLENTQMQILRSALDDRQGGLFPLPARLLSLPGYFSTRRFQ
jgi:hypothetical protein